MSSNIKFGIKLSIVFIIVSFLFATAVTALPESFMSTWLTVMSFITGVSAFITMFVTAIAHFDRY